MRLECAGNGRPSALRLHVGDTFIGQGSDPTGLTGGETGVMAASVNAPEMEVRFDNFVVTRF